MRKWVSAVGFVAVALFLSLPAHAAERFGAIAFSADSGAEGYGVDYATREDAESRAMEECKSRSRGKACTVAAWCQNACCALAVGKGNGWGGFWGVEQKQADLAALGNCGTQTSNCKIRRSFCTAKD